MFHTGWIIECWGTGFSFRAKDGIYFLQSIQIQNQILIFIRVFLRHASHEFIYLRDIIEYLLYVLGDK